MPDKKIRLYAAEVKIFLMIRKLDSIAPGHPYNTCPRKPLCHKKNEEKIDFAYRAVLHSGQKMRCVASLPTLRPRSSRGVKRAIVPLRSKYWVLTGARSHRESSIGPGGVGFSSTWTLSRPRIFLSRVDPRRKSQTLSEIYVFLFGWGGVRFSGLS